MARLLLKAPYLHIRVLMASRCFCSFSSSLFFKPRFVFSFFTSTSFYLFNFFKWNEFYYYFSLNFEILEESNDKITTNNLLQILFFWVIFRTNFAIRGVSSQVLTRSNVVVPRAFLSSSIATEAFKENPVSKTYGSEQIQVSFKNYTKAYYASIIRAIFF